MKNVYPDEKNVVLNENSVEGKPFINRESKINELPIKLYSCHDINMNLLAVVTPPSVYQFHFYPFLNSYPTSCHSVSLYFSRKGYIMVPYKISCIVHCVPIQSNLYSQRTVLTNISGNPYVVVLPHHFESDLMQDMY